MRAAALQGVAELLAARPEAVRRHAARLVAALAVRCADDDADVRKALREALQRAFVPALQEAAAAPFVPLLMASAAAAATHARRGVRVDGMVVAELLLRAYPAAAAGFDGPADEVAGDAEGGGGGGAAALLAAAGERFTASAQGGGAASSGRPAEALAFLGAAEALLGARAADSERIAAGTEAETSGRQWVWGAHGMSEVGLHYWRTPPHALAAAGRGIASATQLVALRDSALRLYAEYIPAAAPGARADVAALRVAAAALRVATNVGDGAEADAAALGEAADRVARFFPLAASARGGGGDDASQPSGKGKGKGKASKEAGLTEVASLLRALDAASADLLCAAAAAESAERGGAPCEARWAAPLAAHIASALSEARRARNTDGSGGGERALDAALQCAETAAAALSREHAAAVLAAVAEAEKAASPASAACLPLVRFLAAAARREALAAPAVLPSWLVGAPRLLWRLGAKNPAASEVVLRALHERAARAREGTPAATALEELQPALAPFFATRLPAAGDGEGKLVFGAFSALPTATQELAVDTVWMIGGGPLPAPLLRGLGLVCAREGLPTAVRERVGALVAARGGGDAVAAGFAEALQRAGRQVPSALKDAHARLTASAS